jgi:hypothetical protein
MPSHSCDTAVICTLLYVPVQTDARLALLLGKYDANLGLATGGPYAPGGPRQQVDTLVDELFERIVVCSMLDPPSKHMSCFMINVDTQEFEPYPEGWWKQVLEVGVGIVRGVTR